MNGRLPPPRALLSPPGLQGLLGGPWLLEPIHERW